jgi:hypothetical protein
MHTFFDSKALYALEPCWLGFSGVDLDEDDYAFLEQVSRKGSANSTTLDQTWRTEWYNPSSRPEPPNYHISEWNKPKLEWYEPQCRQLKLEWWNPRCYDVTPRAPIGSVLSGPRYWAMIEAARLQLQRHKDAAQ